MPRPSRGSELEVSDSRPNVGEVSELLASVEERLARVKDYL
jgi:hypothetical protein